MSTFDDEVRQSVPATKVLARWQAELIAKFERAILIRELIDANFDTSELEAEAEIYLRCAQIDTWLERQASASSNETHKWRSRP